MQSDEQNILALGFSEDPSPHVLEEVDTGVPVGQLFTAADLLVESDGWRGFYVGHVCAISSDVGV